MPWSGFQMAYLAMIVTGFGLFMIVLGTTAILCRSRRGAEEARPPERLQVEQESTKVHGDKLAHSVDQAA